MSYDVNHKSCASIFTALEAVQEAGNSGKYGPATVQYRYLIYVYADKVST